MQRTGTNRSCGLIASLFTMEASKPALVVLFFYLCADFVEPGSPGVLLHFFGGHKAVARPDPIPNSAVKHRIADGSACIARARVGCRRFLFQWAPELRFRSPLSLCLWTIAHQTRRRALQDLPTNSLTISTGNDRQCEQGNNRRRSLSP